jgi:hypothetical protein
LFPGSSVVEQPAVNRLVAGSNPARGAKNIKDLTSRDQPEEKFGVQPGYVASSAINHPDDCETLESTNVGHGHMAGADYSA